MITGAKSAVSHFHQRLYQIGTTRRILTKSSFAALIAFLACGPVRASDAAQPIAASPQATTCATATVWWSELLAPETEHLTEFYAKVMGWNTKIVDAENQSGPARTPDDRYTIFMDGQREIAGLMKANHPDAIYTTVGWFTYMQVPDVKAAAAKALEAGGKILREPTETTEGHMIAVISDPMGNTFGLVTPAKKTPC